MAALRIAGSDSALRLPKLLPRQHDLLAVRSVVGGPVLRQRQRLHTPSARRSQSGGHS